MDEKRERRWIPGEKADYVKELVEIINQEERDDQLAEKLSAYHENDIAEAFELLDEKGRRKLYQVLGYGMDVRSVRLFGRRGHLPGRIGSG